MTRQNHRRQIPAGKNLLICGCVVVAAAMFGFAHHQSRSAFPIYGSRAERLGVSPRDAAGALSSHTRSRTAAIPLVPGSGPVLHRTNTYVVFWKPSGFYMPAGYRSLITQFLSDLAADSPSTTNVYSVASQYWDKNGAARYNTRFAGSYVDTRAFPTNGGCTNSPAKVCLSDTNIRKEVKAIIANESWPVDSMSKGSIYFVVLPRDVDMCSPGEGRGTCAESIWESCSDLSGCVSSPLSLGCTAGYHNYYPKPAVSGETVIYSPVAYSNSTLFQCTHPDSQPNGSDADYTISTISHELIEAATDPLLNNWATPTRYEIGDLCEALDQPYVDQVINGHRYNIQQEYSDLLNGGACASYSATPPSATVLNTSSAPITSAPAGAPVTVQGSGFDPFEPLSIKLDGTSFASITPSGAAPTSFSIATHIPSSASVGPHTLSVQGRYTGVSASMPFSVASVPLSYYSGHIVQWAGDTKTQKTAWYVSPDLTRHWIYDAATYNCLRSNGAPPADVLPASALDQLPDITGSWATCNGPAFEGSIVRGTSSNWVIVNRQRHQLLDPSTDLCARYLDHRQVSFTNVPPAAVQSIPLGATYSCNLNNSILTAQDQPDPKPSYAITNGQRHWIPDKWTYLNLRETQRFSQAIPINTDAEIHALPDGGDETPSLNPADIPVYSIVRRNDNVSWVVDPNHVRHHIPYAQDDVCWRDLNGRVVSATGLTYDQANEVGAEDTAHPATCIIGPRVVKSSDGSSWFVDSANTRHWIPDVDTYWYLARRNPVSGPWPAEDVNQIPRGSDAPKQLDGADVAGRMICHQNGQCWTVDANGYRHYVPTWKDNVCLRRTQGWSIARQGLIDSQVQSIPELGQQTCSIGGPLIVSSDDGSSWLLRNDSRAWIPDPAAYWFLRGQYPNAGTWPDSEVRAFGEVSSMAGLQRVSIWANGNGRYVSAEIGYGGADYGMLRARSTSVGGWESFLLVGDCSNACAIRSYANGLYTSAELGYQGYAWGEMRARNSDIGGWEQFRLVGNCSTGCGILSLANGRYVSAELGFTGAGYAMLRARATSIGGWEQFRIG